MRFMEGIISSPNNISSKQRKFFAAIVYIFFTAFITYSQEALQPIGQWREHLPYQNTIQVVATPNKIFAATIYNVFSVEGETITRYSKTTGLNDIGVNAIAWDETSQQLVIGYTNSNLDILKDRNVRNIGDIKRSTVSGDKTIYHIYCRQGKAYLSTGIGIIVVDLLKYEIADTWRIGNNGAQVKINGVVIDATHIYAATNEGLKRVQINSPNIGNFQNWKQLSGTNGLPAGAVRMVMQLENKIVALKDNTVFQLANNLWSIFYTDPQWPVVSINAAENKLLISQRTASGNSRVIILNSLGNVERTLAQPGIISFPRWATSKNNEIWVADFFAGLSKFGTSIERYTPNGPPGIATGEMVVYKKSLYAAAGSVNDAWNYTYNRNGIYIFQEGQWKNINSSNTPALDSVLDFVPIVIDPTNESIWAGSYGGGLANINGNKTTIYKANNSPLQPAIGDPTSYRVSGLAFDANNNLWIGNYGAPQNLSVRKSDGNFKAFSIPFFHTENAVSEIEIDDANQVWIVSPKGNGLFVYNPGNSIDNLNDDNWKFLKVGAGSGNLPSNDVFTVTKDKNGFMWIGTSRGIGIVQCPEKVFQSQGCQAILPVVQQDRFAGFLFQDEEVRTIAVDGANRKWIGTRNGVWLISADGNKIIYRFTEDNSPLLSNDIKRIAIDPESGEVYISTFKGICSFRSTATETTASNNSVLVFPNPVPPGYSGTIAIRGIANNAIVKIAEMNGRLVYQTRALGGQAIWNGLNYKGEKVASGVYLVLVKDDAGTDRMVTKIVMVSGR